MLQDLFPPSAEHLTIFATQELIATAQALINLGAPTLSREALHEWLLSPEEFTFLPVGEGNPNEGTPKA